MQMKRITFFIGNGFDINVGLPTKYSQFYKYYKTQYPEDMLAKEIDADYDYWADMEVGLGKFTSKINEDNEALFWESEERLEEALADYLELQTQNIDLDTKENAEIMKNSLMRFYEDFPKEQKQDLDRCIRNIGESITYSFVSLNYTNILDRCVEAGKEVFPKGIGNHKTANGSEYVHTIGDVLHIHGTINEELILGVNDIDQIANEKFKKDVLYRQFLIKSEANKRFGQNKIQDTKQLIDNSAIICVFGASIGSTDKMWWTYICKWLQTSSHNRLIIFAKNDKQHSRITKHFLFGSENKILGKLKENSGLNNDEWANIQSHIYIKFDSNIFRFSIKKNQGESIEKVQE